MANLDSLTWTAANDKKTSYDGWFLAGAFQVETDINQTPGGDDTIFGKSGVTYGIYLTDQAKLYTQGGNDNIQGVCTNSGLSNQEFHGIYLTNGSELNTGVGSDTIEGTSDIGFGITLYASLIQTYEYTRSDIEADTISGVGKSKITGGGINTSASIILMGGGADVLKGSGSYGIKVDQGSLIDTGEGNDKIFGEGYNRPGLDLLEATLFGGDGDDLITGTYRGSSTYYPGIQLGGATIDGGNGNDTIKADIIVNNRGLITTGAGRDTIEATSSTETRPGFFQDSSGGPPIGRYELGEDDDLVKGYGSGYFDGGDGFADTLRLPKGTYIIKSRVVLDLASNIEYIHVKSSNLLDGSSGMYLVNFERIGRLSGATYLLSELATPDGNTVSF